MIIRSVCNTCFQVYEVHSEPTDTSLLKEIISEDLMAPCPRLCGGQINMVTSGQITALANDPRLKAPLPITAKELFKAVKGAGLPDEIPKSEDVVSLLFGAARVHGVTTESLNGHVYLHEIKFENGAVLHLASGMRGAEVLKITKGAE